MNRVARPDLGRSLLLTALAVGCLYLSNYTVANPVLALIDACVICLLSMIALAGDWLYACAAGVIAAFFARYVGLVEWLLLPSYIAGYVCLLLAVYWLRDKPIFLCVPAAVVAFAAASFALSFPALMLFRDMRAWEATATSARLLPWPSAGALVGSAAAYWLNAKRLRKGA